MTHGGTIIAVAHETGLVVNSRVLEVKAKHRSHQTRAKAQSIVNVVSSIFGRVIAMSASVDSMRG